MFNPIKYTWRFFDTDKKMMLEQPLGWEPQDSFKEGDALWRTGLSYIAYKKPVLKEGILSCYRKYDMIDKKGKYFYQAMRCAGRYREDDVSRDQTVMSLAALAINGDMEEFKEIGLHLPYRLSRRFKMGPTMWLWIRAVATKKKFYTALYALSLLMEYILPNLYNKLAARILKINKEYTIDELFRVDDSVGFWHKRDGTHWVWLNEPGVNDSKKMYGAYKKKLDENKFLKFLDMARYPAFAVHLTAWMVYCLEDGFWKRLLQRVVWWSSEKSNLLIKLLVGKNVSMGRRNRWEPLYGFRWQRRLDGTSYEEKLKGEDAIYNVIDKDVLLAL